MTILEEKVSYFLKKAELYNINLPKIVFARESISRFSVEEKESTLRPSLWTTS